MGHGQLQAASLSEVCEDFELDVTCVISESEHALDEIAIDSLVHYCYVRQDRRWPGFLR